MRKSIRVKSVLATIFLMLAAAVLYGLLVEPAWLTTRHLAVENAGLHGALAGKIGVHL